MGVIGLRLGLVLALGLGLGLVSVCKVVADPGRVTLSVLPVNCYG